MVKLDSGGYYFVEEPCRRSNERPLAFSSRLTDVHEVVEYRKSSVLMGNK